jgi:hypothetical protein
LKAEQSGKITYAHKDNSMGGKDNVQKVLLLAKRLKSACVYDNFRELQMMKLPDKDKEKGSGDRNQTS